MRGTRWPLTVAAGVAVALCSCAGPAQNPAADGPTLDTGVGTDRRLPLKRGFYVREDIACEEASNATLTLLHTDGFGYARSSCTFASIERLSDSRYRTSERCEPLVEEGEPASTRTMIYALSGDTAFQVEGADVPAVRFCPQSSLPEPWRSNDVPDIDN